MSSEFESHPIRPLSQTRFFAGPAERFRYLSDVPIESLDRIVFTCLDESQNQISFALLTISSSAKSSELQTSLGASNTSKKGCGWGIQDAFRRFKES
jgi:hypothetical protein